MQPQTSNATDSGRSLETSTEEVINAIANAVDGADADPDTVLPQNAVSSAPINTRKSNDIEEGGDQRSQMTNKSNDSELMNRYLTSIPHPK